MSAFVETVSVYNPSAINFNREQLKRSFISVFGKGRSLRVNHLNPVPNRRDVPFDPNEYLMHVTITRFLIIGWKILTAKEQSSLQCSQYSLLWVVQAIGLSCNSHLVCYYWLDAHTVENSIFLIEKSLMGSFIATIKRVFSFFNWKQYLERAKSFVTNSNTERSIGYWYKETLLVFNLISNASNNCFSVM